VLSPLMRPMSPSLASWIVVAVALIVAERLVVYPLRRVAPEISLGVVYLVGVLVVPGVRGLLLGVVAAVLSAAASGFCYVSPSLDLVPCDPGGPAALTVLLAVALVLCCVAAVARSRSIGAGERRGEAGLAAAMAGLLLRTDDLRCARPGASGRLARARRLSAAAIELEAVAGEARRAAFALHDGRHAAGSRRPAADDGAARAGAGGGVGAGAFARGARLRGDGQRR
jgi:two-component system sensor histidine kinase KdpD